MSLKNVLLMWEAISMCTATIITINFQLQHSVISFSRPESFSISEQKSTLTSKCDKISEHESKLFTVKNHSDHKKLHTFLFGKLKLYEALQPDNSNTEACENGQEESYSINYTENNWTKRLYCGIKDHFSSATITPMLTCSIYASKDGFKRNVKWSGKKDIPINVVPFHGTPDITVTTVSGTKLVEIADMNKLMLCKEGKLRHPEKLGQLLAAMMTMTYCGIIKRWDKGDMSAKPYITHGLLLRRLGNGYIVKMKMIPYKVTEINQTPLAFEVDVKFLSPPILEPGVLCKTLTYFFLL